jgi:hypothetical protein
VKGHKRRAALNGYARISLPSEIADELVDAEMAVRIVQTRGPRTAEFFSMTVDCINTGSAVVSISIAVVTCRRLAVAAIRRRHPAEPNSLTLVIKGDGKSKSLTVDRTLPTAEDAVLDFIIETLDA